MKLRGQDGLTYHITRHIILNYVLNTIPYPVLTIVIPQTYLCLHRQGRSLPPTGSVPLLGGCLSKVSHVGHQCLLYYLYLTCGERPRTISRWKQLQNVEIITRGIDIRLYQRCRVSCHNNTESTTGLSRLSFDGGDNSVRQVEVRRQCPQTRYRGEVDLTTTGLPGGKLVGDSVRFNSLVTRLLPGRFWFVSSRCRPHRTIPSMSMRKCL